MPEARPARPLGKRRAFLRERWDFVKVPGSRIENDRVKPLSLGIRNLEAPASAFWCLVGWWFTRLGRVASSAGLRGPDSRKSHNEDFCKDRLADGSANLV